MATFPLRFLSLRDLRNTPGALWRKLRGGATVAITSSGEPRALIIGIEGEELPDVVRLVARLRAQLATSRLRARAAEQGRADLTPEEVEREVRAARAARR